MPVQVVGIGVLRAGRDGGGAELQGEVLPGRGRESGRGAEGVILVQAAAEGSVVINVDRCRVDFVTADEDGLLAGREGPLGRRLPFQPQEIGGVEGILLIDLLIQPLPDPEGQIVSELAFDVQIQVVPLEMGVIHTVGRLLVESGACVDGHLLHVRLLRPQKGCREQEG